MQVFRWIGIIIKWVPHVVSAVVTIEGLLGEGLSGAEKKMAALAWLSKTGAKLGLPWTEAAVQVVSTLVDTVVGIMNLLGLFRHRDDAPAEEVAAAVGLARDTQVARVASVERAIGEDPELAAFLARTQH